MNSGLDRWRSRIDVLRGRPSGSGGMSTEPRNPRMNPHCYEPSPILSLSDALGKSSCTDRRTCAKNKVRVLSKVVAANTTTNFRKQGNERCSTAAEPSRTPQKKEKQDVPQAGKIAVASSSMSTSIPSDSQHIEKSSVLPFTSGVPIYDAKTRAALDVCSWVENDINDSILHDQKRTRTSRIHHKK